MGRTRGRLSLKELGQLAGGIHHDAVSIAIRRFETLIKNDPTLRGKLFLVEKALKPA
jgi:chromosomal replication initiation ATPase DnaA